MRRDWINLSSNPTVATLINTLAELQERVVRLEADMVLLKANLDPNRPDLWTVPIDSPSDQFLQETK